MGPPLPRGRPQARRHIRQRRLPDEPDPRGRTALLGDLPDDQGRGPPPNLGEALQKGETVRRSCPDLETPTLPIMHLDPSIRLSELLPRGFEKLLCKIYHKFGFFRADETGAILDVVTGEPYFIPRLDQIDDRTAVKGSDGQAEAEMAPLHVTSRKEERSCRMESAVVGCDRHHLVLPDLQVSLRRREEPLCCIERGFDPHRRLGVAFDHALLDALVEPHSSTPLTRT